MAFDRASTVYNLQKYLREEPNNTIKNGFVRRHLRTPFGVSHLCMVLPLVGVWRRAVDDFRLSCSVGLIQLRYHIEM